jgi:hypothetical protein
MSALVVPLVVLFALASLAVAFLLFRQRRRMKEKRKLVGAPAATRFGGGAGVGKEGVDGEGAFSDVRNPLSLATPPSAGALSSASAAPPPTSPIATPSPRARSLARRGSSRARKLVATPSSASLTGGGSGGAGGRGGSGASGRFGGPPLLSAFPSSPTLPGSLRRGEQSFAFRSYSPQRNDNARGSSAWRRRLVSAASPPEAAAA